MSDIEKLKALDKKDKESPEYAIEMIRLAIGEIKAMIGDHPGMITFDVEDCQFIKEECSQADEFCDTLEHQIDEGKTYEGFICDNGRDAGIICDEILSHTCSKQYKKNKHCRKIKLKETK